MHDIQELLSQMQEAIKNSVSEKQFGVAFSGGVDSTTIVKLCADLGYDITLLTIGFENSHDILFAKQVNESLKLSHKILEIESESFEKVCSDIGQQIQTDNLSWNENCIAFYYVAKLAKEHGIDSVITANGMDELFCGYNAYREAYEGAQDKIMELMDSKLNNEIKMMKAVNDVTSEFGVKIIQPLLNSTFIEYGKKIPIEDKIYGVDDMQRKHIIRKLALEIGVPELSANKRKKALQYGSLIHKTLIKSR